MSAWTTLLVLLLTVCKAPVAHPWQHQRYLLPVVNFGPNNQLRRLRYLIALARQLNRTVILPSIVRHRSDRAHHTLLDMPGCLKEEEPHQLQFADVIDRAFLEQWTPVTTTGEMYAQGWDGLLEALVIPREKSLQEVLPYFTTTVQGVKAQVENSMALIKTDNKLQCKAQAIAKYARLVDGYRVIAVYHTVVGHSDPMYMEDEGLNEPPADSEGGCWRDLFNANRRLRAAAWWRNLAAEYIQKHIGHEPFMAMHVRPQSDKCLQLWEEHRLEQAARKRGWCWAGHERLHLNVGPKAKALLQQHGVNKLVVLTHPNLQGIVQELLVAVNITNAQFIDAKLVHEIAGCVDNTPTFLMMVEGQIAVQSKVFLGTASSSITETIVYERLANGVDMHEFLDKQVVTRKEIKPVPNYAPLPS